MPKICTISGGGGHLLVVGHWCSVHQFQISGGGGGAIGTSTGAQEHRMGMLGAGGNTNAGQSTYTGQDILAVIACSIFCIMSIKAKYIL